MSGLCSGDRALFPDDCHCSEGRCDHDALGNNIIDEDERVLRTEIRHILNELYNAAV